MTKYVYPFELDEKDYFLANLVENKLEIKTIKRRDFPPNLVSSHINFLINRGIVDDAACFYSGLQCWLPNFDINNVKVDTNLCMSKDHASSIKIATLLGLKENAKKSHNIVPCCSYLNRNMGHTPLSIKLFYKKELSKLSYDRNILNLEALELVTQTITRIQQSLMYKGLFVWQPWTYKEGADKEYALTIFERLIEAEKQFLQIDKLRPAIDWLNNYDTSWIEQLSLELKSGAEAKGSRAINLKKSNQLKP